MNPVINYIIFHRFPYGFDFLRLQPWGYPPNARKSQDAPRHGCAELARVPRVVRLSAVDWVFETRRL